MGIAEGETQAYNVTTQPVSFPRFLPEDQLCTFFDLPIAMHSLDEPLDLKLSITKLRAAREKRERTLGVARHHTLHRELGLVDDSPTPGSPGSPPPGIVPERAASMLVRSSCEEMRPAQFPQWAHKAGCSQGLWEGQEKVEGANHQ